MSWASLPIGEIAHPRLGGNYDNSSVSTRRPLIKMGNMGRVDIDLTRVDYILDSVDVDPIHRLGYGDVLLNTRNTLDLVGKVSIWRDELPVAYYNSNILRLEFNSEICGDSRYFGYALNSNGIVEKIRALATGTTSVAAIYARDLMKLLLPVPGLVEQRVIVDALEDISRLITSLERLVAKKRAIKQGMMQELLTGRTRLPGFVGDWNCSLSLNAVSTKSSGYWGVEPGAGELDGRVIRAGDVGPEHKLRGYALRGLTAAEATRARCEVADVILTSSGTIGNVALIMETDYFASNFVRILRPKRGVLGAYLYYALQSTASRTAMDANLGISAMPNLGGSFYREPWLDLPSEKEQEVIVEVLREIDAEVEAIERRLKATRAVKQGMMQELLTGRTRLVPAAEASS